MFSGFTVIGLPNDAYNLGWIAFVWVAGQQAVCTAFCLTAPRLRKASIVRNHQSPSDFITDMFQSQLLRYAVIISQLLAQFIWMTSNGAYFYCIPYSELMICFTHLMPSSYLSYRIYGFVFITYAIAQLLSIEYQIGFQWSLRDPR